VHGPVAPRGTRGGHASPARERRPPGKSRFARRKDWRSLAKLALLSLPGRVEPRREPGRAAFAGRVRELAHDNAHVTAIVEPLLTVLSTMLDQLAHLTRQVLAIVRGEAVCRRLMSVPGVGPITALAFRATIDQPARFRRSRDVGAHLGLTPARYQSGETDIQGKVSRCGDELARTALYEAAHTLLVRSQKWSALRAWGMKVAKARGMARARVAVARKLAVILHRMWIEGTGFRFGRERAAALAA
jgi:transposase